MKAKATLLASALDAILIDADGIIKIYGGAPPDDVEDTAGTLLAICVFESDAEWQPAAANSGNLSATAVCDPGSAGYVAKDVSIDADGTATYFRICDIFGTAILQGTIDELGLETTEVTEGSPFVINTLSVTIGYCAADEIDDSCPCPPPTTGDFTSLVYRVHLPACIGCADYIDLHWLSGCTWQGQILDCPFEGQKIVFFFSYYPSTHWQLNMAFYYLSSDPHFVIYQIDAGDFECESLNTLEHNTGTFPWGDCDSESVFTIEKL